MHAYLEQHGLKLSRGTIVDATIIHAPSSTKNAAQARDPEEWFTALFHHLSPAMLRRHSLPSSGTPHLA